VLVKTEADTPTAVFYDPTGRRRRALRVALLIALCAAVAITALVLVALTARSSVPRTLIGLAPTTSGPGGTGIGPAAALLSQRFQSIR
jgi:hypothetical protein